MPLVILVIVVLAGLGCGGSFFSEYVSTFHVREMSCEEFYQHPVTSGYVRLTGARTLRYQTYVLADTKTGQTVYAYSPVIADVEHSEAVKYRLAVKESKSQAVRLAADLRSLKDASNEDAVSFIRSHQEIFVPVGVIEGKIIDPQEDKNMMRGTDDRYAPDFVVVDPEQWIDSKRTQLLALGIVSTILGALGLWCAWVLYLGPKLSRDPRRLADRNGFVGLAGLSAQEIRAELDHGAKFVVYTYCFSVLVLTFKRPSPVYFITRRDNCYLKGLPYAFISLCAGWWGIPWGPVYTLQSLFVCLKGGQDVFEKVIETLQMMRPQAGEATTDTTTLSQ